MELCRAVPRVTRFLNYKGVRFSSSQCTSKIAFEKPNKFIRRRLSTETPNRSSDSLFSESVNVLDKALQPQEENFAGPVFDRNFVSTVLDEFIRKPTTKLMADEYHLYNDFYIKAFLSFRLHCLASLKNMAKPLATTFDDIRLRGENVDSLFPHFIEHSRKIFPFLDSVEELKKISDITQPHAWYPNARALRRKFIFHAGPTNSGKTYAALERLLAVEIYRKMNNIGKPCDLVTGEDRKHAINKDEPAPLLSTTVDMLSPDMSIELGVIDEIQMVRDDRRGYAFTRALLGMQAPVVNYKLNSYTYQYLLFLIHLCGEEAAIDIVQRILEPTGEPIEINRYERKSALTISTHGLGGLENIQDGDCIVSFSKSAIVDFARQLQLNHGREAAIIYGDLPPITKLTQAEKFNDPNDPCNVLVATDAIGMGLNLNIKRIIFSTLDKFERTTLDQQHLPIHLVKQIAGRAGRFGLKYEEGVVMGFTDEDASVLCDIITKDIENIEKAGIAPTFEQIETFALLLPTSSFVELMNIFACLCTVSDHYFTCFGQDSYGLAKVIENIPLSLKDRYTFCLVPLNSDRMNLSTFFMKIVQRYSDGLVINFDYVHNLIKHLMDQPAYNLAGLENLCDAHDCVGAYLWLSYRFPTYFPDNSVQHLANMIEERARESLENINAGKAEQSISPNSPKRPSGSPSKRLKR
ncbi:ATP-dependent RNA helicase SUV3 like protein, mitochondrial [Ditylenchus destructor]|uniref:ATP-dependent RNA helicase SUV3 like protein, mitochondrial n=1 Tax=Ditylenchus destructor TaxID=166010 RepID=A0AAD4R6T8_9BILA|nr:ATP-dependent RNA helicase SUV3 like protein, mitochondrial [Ditylenchus destructor]